MTRQAQLMFTLVDLVSNWLLSLADELMLLFSALRKKTDTLPSSAAAFERRGAEPNAGSVEMAGNRATAHGAAASRSKMAGKVISVVEKCAIGEWLSKSKGAIHELMAKWRNKTKRYRQHSKPARGLSLLLFYVYVTQVVKGHTVPKRTEKNAIKTWHTVHISPEKYLDVGRLTHNEGVISRSWTLGSWDLSLFGLLLILIHLCTITTWLSEKSWESREVNGIWQACIVVVHRKGLRFTHSL